MTVFLSHSSLNGAVCDTQRRSEKGVKSETKEEKERVGRKQS